MPRHRPFFGALADREEQESSVPSHSFHMEGVLAAIRVWYSPGKSLAGLKE